MSSGGLDAEWESFCLNGTPEPEPDAMPSGDVVSSTGAPDATPLKISTKTKIVYLNTTTLNLDRIFWTIDVIRYAEPKGGVIKKQMKVTVHSSSALKTIAERLAVAPSYKTSHIKGNPEKCSESAPYVMKVNVGLSRKDIMSQRNKEKGAFYNCFMLVMRVPHHGTFHEVNLKVFNTGKLSFPGMLSPELLAKSLDLVCDYLTLPGEQLLTYNSETIDTVLVNSNFACGFYIDRDALVEILKCEQSLHVSYDPCSYPGIQCKFFIPCTRKHGDDIGDGVCRCTSSCAGKRANGTCQEVSFMVFRTGSVLIVGRCNENILHAVYDRLKSMLKELYTAIVVPTPANAKHVLDKPRKPKTHTLIVDVDPSATKLHAGQSTPEPHAPGH